MNPGFSSTKEAQGIGWGTPGMNPGFSSTCNKSVPGSASLRELFRLLLHMP